METGADIPLHTLTSDQVSFDLLNNLDGYMVNRMMSSSPLAKPSHQEEIYREWRRRDILKGTVMAVLLKSLAHGA